MATLLTVLHKLYFEKLFVQFALFFPFLLIFLEFPDVNCLSHMRLNAKLVKMFRIKSFSLADPRGGTKDVRPPGSPNSFIFMQFSAKI